jgi:hypothetical protein
MEDVLDVYASTHTSEEPLICMDEASKQLVEDEHPPLPMQPGQPVREDYHYERKDVAALFMFFNPIQGWRRVSVSESRTRYDWAEQIRQLLEQDYPNARKIKLICDNLNTHHIASLYHAFPADKAHQLARRLEIHYTPRNGSWLNMAEIELSILAKQCLDRRIGSFAHLTREVTQWNIDRNATRSVVHWRFTAKDARIKLHRLYPQF